MAQVVEHQPSKCKARVQTPVLPFPPKKAKFDLKTEEKEIKSPN
jgi:hypothetical protein